MPLFFENGNLNMEQRRLLRSPESDGKEVKVLQGPVDLAVGNRRSSRAVVSSVRTTRIDVGVSDSTALPPRDASVAPHTTPGAPVGPIAVTPARASVEPHTTPDALVASSTPVTGEPKSVKRPRENSAVAVDSRLKPDAVSVGKRSGRGRPCAAKQSKVVPEVVPTSRRGPARSKKKVVLSPELDVVEVSDDESDSGFTADACLVSQGHRIIAGLVYDFASPPGATPVAIMVLAVSGRSRRDASTCRCCALMLLGFVGFACVNAPG